MEKVVHFMQLVVEITSVSSQHSSPALERKK